MQGLPGIRPPAIGDNKRSAWHLYVIRCEKRDDFQRELAAIGVQTLIHYPIPPGRQAPYRDGFDSKTSPNGDVAAAECLSLPLWPEMADDEIAFVINAVQEVATNLSTP
jgi:dTDP-4-amino-4,6-dideoxygalactose transaminase